MCSLAEQSFSAGLVLHFFEKVTIATLRGYRRQDYEDASDDSRPRTRMSAYVIAEALLRLYSKKGLFPDGMTADNPLAQKWAVKIGLGCRKLVPGLHAL